MSMPETDKTDRPGRDIARPPIRSETRDRLRAAKIGAESYDDVVNRLLDEVEGSQEGEYDD